MNDQLQDQLSDEHEDTVIYASGVQHEGGHEEHHLHVTPFWTMLWVFVVLIILTILTVWSSNVHYLGVGNSSITIDSNMHITLALVIATVKAVLVGAYFMHLLYDKAINTVVVGATLFATVLFIGFTLFDLSNRSTVVPEEGGGAFVNHPLVRQMPEPMATDAAGSIFPGGQLELYAGNARGEAARFDFGKPKALMSVVDYVREAAAAEASNPPADGSEEESDPTEAEEAETDGQPQAASGTDSDAG